MPKKHIYGEGNVSIIHKQLLKFSNKTNKLISKTGKCSGQDRSIGRYTLPPCTKRRTTNLKQKNMNSKMTTNSQLSTNEPKKQKQKQTKQTTKQEQNHRNGDHMGVISGEKVGGKWGKSYRE